MNKKKRNGGRRTSANQAYCELSRGSEEGRGTKNRGIKETKNGRFEGDLGERDSHAVGGGKGEKKRIETEALKAKRKNRGGSGELGRSRGRGSRQEIMGGRVQVSRRLNMSRSSTSDRRTKGGGRGNGESEFTVGAVKGKWGGWGKHLIGGIETIQRSL